MGDCFERSDFVKVQSPRKLNSEISFDKLPVIMRAISEGGMASDQVLGIISNCHNVSDGTAS